jgi:hypothetical protein
MDLLCVKAETRPGLVKQSNKSAGRAKNFSVISSVYVSLPLPLMDAPLFFS